MYSGLLESSVFEGFKESSGHHKIRPMAAALWGSRGVRPVGVESGLDVRFWKKLLLLVVVMLSGLVCGYVLNTMSIAVSRVVDSFNGPRDSVAFTSFGNNK